MSGTIPFKERLTCTIPALRDATGLGNTKIYELIANGRIKTRKVGRRTLVVVESVLDALDLTAPQSPKERLDAEPDAAEASRCPRQLPP
jgi:hypothetical protein